MSLNRGKYFIPFLLFFTCFSTFSQMFERVEHLAGLEVLKENNGVAVADYDGDLDLDIFVVAKSKDQEGVLHSYSKLFRNNNDNTFTDVTLEAGLNNLYPKEDDGVPNPSLEGHKYGASWGDYNNDGFPDLFLTNEFKLQLFKNNGDGTFKDVTTEAGINQTNTCWNTTATWFDFNNDGYIDIYVSDWGKCDYNLFLLNNKDGTFSKQTTLFAKTTANNKSFTSIPFDFNNDGWMDLYVANDTKVENNLFINHEGVFVTEEASKYKIDNPGNDMGVAMNDFNNDGLFDIFVTNINENVFYKNNGDNTYTDIAESLNLKDTGWGWDIIFADFDLDGDEDIFTVNGFNITKAQNNFYFENTLKNGVVGFRDKTEEENLKELTYGVSAVPFDFDNDGDLDLYTTNSDRESFLYKNATIKEEESSKKWFKISLEGTTSNKNAIGTTLTIKTDAGTFHRYYTGISFLSQSILPVHFGLKNATIINELTIKWPSGLVETHTNLTPNNFIKATEGNGYLVLDVKPSDKIYGCTDPNSCSYNPNATDNDGSCTYLTAATISGSSASAFTNKETYSINNLENTTVTWSVKGGEIIEGQNTKSVVVEWGFYEEGTISVIYKDSNCSSSTSVLKVNLDLNNIALNFSISRIWNEALLESIRNDFARPNVHARNLFHASIAMYDIWSIYQKKGEPYLMGRNVGGFKSDLNDFTPEENIDISIKKAISYAMYRLLYHRFKTSPGSKSSLERYSLIMSQLGYDTQNTSIDYSTGDAAAFGNFVAETIINYGLKDGSREITDYDYSYYSPLNDPLDLSKPGIGSGLKDPNRWQPLTFNTFIDQSGNQIVGSTPSFLGPEWGNVQPFALNDDNKTIHVRDNNTFNIYHNPGQPPFLDINNSSESSNQYKWNFALVSIWSSHLDAKDGVMWDISPKTLGNIDINSFTSSFVDLPNYYKELDGGDYSNGHSMNPSTQLPYEEQMVPRGDYTRVLAEFWADGPDSETPPGHWFTILNHVNDHPMLVKKMNGTGAIVDDLEWDVKAYFILAGAMHDSAISAWSIKGWHDYIRPISAIRYMSSLGQSSNPDLPNYHVAGIPLQENYIELVTENDALSGENNEHLGKIKVLAWKGHDYVNNSTTDVAGVDWILAEKWWPYQRPSFVTPPFAGYVSGHSTFSRAAAEVLTLITGDEYFPGGMAEFVAKKDEFLVFEKGPSVDIRLQWATYRDASDQTSLSRIWGGIHPPADDINGRLIGEQVGVDAFNFATNYFNGESSLSVDDNILLNDFKFYPNPIEGNSLNISNTLIEDSFTLYDVLGNQINILKKEYDKATKTSTLILPNLSTGVYFVTFKDVTKKIIKQ